MILARICAGLEFFGIEIDEKCNSAGAILVSSGRVTVLVIHTDKELMIAKSVCHTPGLQIDREIIHENDRV